MCIVCKLWNIGQLTKPEADRALAELLDETSNDKDVLHAQEVLLRIELEGPTNE